MNRVADAGNPAGVLDLHDALFEQAQAAPRPDDRLSIGRRDRSIRPDSILDPMLPPIQIIVRLHWRADRNGADQGFGFRADRPGKSFGERWRQIRSGKWIGCRSRSAEVARTGPAVGAEG